MPPQNLEAEQSVLGSVLLDNEVFSRIEGTLRADHFYKEGHRKIFRGMERLFRRGDPMDLVTLTEELRQSGELEGVGSVPYLIGLADSVPTAAYAENYARIVVEKAILRDLIATSGTIMQSAYDQAMPLEQILDKAEASIFDMASAKRTQDFQGMGELVTDTFAYINELFANPDPVSGLRTGFKELDQLTAGLQPSSLNVLAARPSMGKTSLALSIAQHVALRESKPVGVFSLEMSGLQLVTRMLCSEARVDMSRVRNGQLSDRDFQRLADTAGRMSEAKVYIDDNADMTVMELRSRARRLVAEHGPGLIVIDYLQLMSGGNSENRQQEISHISRGLKALARELDVPVLVLSQLSRAVESRPNKRPMLSDLRECVTGDTLVVMADGRRVPIRDLVGKTPEVVAVSSDGRLMTAPSDKVWEVGEREVYEVRLASGRRLRATEKHRLLTEVGWRRINQITTDTRLALARQPLAAVPPSTNVDTLPRGVFDRAKSAMTRRGVSQGAMVSMRGTSYGGTSHFAFSPSRQTILEYADLLEDTGLHEWATSDLFWDRVESVTAVGRETVYDLTVPGPESWLADGIVSHNSGAIEQDADLVMFIYRDEYYDTNSEKQGIAEVIIGKQRNGPVGTVELQFHNAHVRFNDLARSTG